MRCTKTINITVLRFYDFVRLSIVISFPIRPRQMNCNAVTEKKLKCFFSCKINVRTGFLHSENMGKDTKNDFLSQKLKKLWGTGIKYLAHLAQTVILFFACMTEKLLKGARVEFVGLWSGTFLIPVHMICQVQVNTHSLFHFGTCK